MYTEEYEDRGFSIKKILFRFIIIVIIIILIIFLMAKIIMPKLDNSKSNDNSSNINEVMEENASTVKNAIFNYYSDKEISTSETITLNKMIDMGIIKSLKDIENNNLNYDDSYIQISEITSDEYSLKINFKTKSNEKYYIIYFGKYNYCENVLCEKDDSKISNTNNQESINPEENEEYNDNIPIKQSIEEANKTQEAEEKTQNENKENIQTETLYQYEKITPVKMSDWSEWTDWEKTTCTFNNIECIKDDENCLLELKVKRESNNTVCYKSIRKRTKLSSSYKTTRWSVYEDKELLQDGWYYTGKTKESK